MYLLWTANIVSFLGCTSTRSCWFTSLTWKPGWLRAGARLRGFSMAPTRFHSGSFGGPPRARATGFSWVFTARKGLFSFSKLGRGWTRAGEPERDRVAAAGDVERRRLLEAVVTARFGLAVRLFEDPESGTLQAAELLSPSCCFYKDLFFTFTKEVDYIRTKLRFADLT